MKRVSSKVRNAQLVNQGVMGPDSNVDSKLFQNERPILETDGALTSTKPETELKYLIDDSKAYDTLHNKAVSLIGCAQNNCVGSVVIPEVICRRPGQPRSKAEVIEQAKDFFEQYYTSIDKLHSPAHEQRLQEVIDTVKTEGIYELTYTELTFGAKTAWRNAPRCIGRIQWNKLQVFDAREIRTARGMFEALCNHIKYGTNKGNIRSAITIFPPRRVEGHDYRVWNAQLVRYAGYKQEDGTFIGDPANVDFTKLCMKLGWKGRGGRFDVLPLVLQAHGADPEVFEIPSDIILEVILKHPRFSWFEELGYQWYCLPAVAYMMMDCGGLEFTAAPFNGWYMGTEIGARDLCDPSRYNITKIVAERMGLDVRRNASLWKDAAMLEVNVAVLHSFQKVCVTIMDHHTAAESFMRHMETENRVRGGCPSDWVWIVPPMSGSLCPVFHQEMLMYKLKPSYEYQTDPILTHVFKSHGLKGKLKGGTTVRSKKLTVKEFARAAKVSAEMMGKALSKRIKCTILYASETGKSEMFARSLGQTFSNGFDAKVCVMSEYDVTELQHEAILLVVTSTFGNGDPPDNGVEFASSLQAMLPKEQKTFSVFALGSSAYPNYCKFGRLVDWMLESLGGDRIYPLGEGDELCGQDDSYKEWSKGLFKAACDIFCMEDQLRLTPMSSQQDTLWSFGKYKLAPVNDEKSVSRIQGLSLVHKKKITQCTLLSRTQLQSSKSDRQTILLQFRTNGEESLKYIPGDHIGIYPENRSDIIEIILNRVGGTVRAEDLTQLEVRHETSTPWGPMKSWIPYPQLPPCTLREALTRYLDITTPPSQSFLGQLAKMAALEVDRNRLQTLATKASVYNEWRREFYPNLAEVLVQVPSVTLPATLLLSQLPRLQCRWYSISSAPEAHPGEIHVTVLVINYRTQGGQGQVRHGVCSSWMNTISPGETVPVCIRRAPNFHLPDEKQLPVIMVGPGTGIAPLRSFWQQRNIDMMKEKQSKGKSSLFGPMTLYFGCRNSDQDNLYAKERQQMVKKGVLTEFLALSRQPKKPKTYVQHMMLRQAKEVYRQIEKDGGHLYVCGDVSMASDVSDTLEDILRTEGGFTEEQAKAYLAQMKENNRFHEDIFGSSVGQTTVRK